MEQDIRELRPALWSVITFPIFAAGGLYCFVFSWLIKWAESPRRGDIDFILLTLLFAGLGLWFVLGGLARIRREHSFRIRADSTGVTMNYRSKKTHITWSQIHSCSVEHEGFEGYGQWVTLRDKQDSILLQWDRDWYAYDVRAFKQFDAFTNFVQDKVDGQKTS